MGARVTWEGLNIMRFISIPLLTAVSLALGMTGPTRPAMAKDWSPVTSMDLTGGFDDPQTWDQFEAPVSALRFSAVHGPVRCRRIVAVYADGTRQQIFSGRIEHNTFRDADFDGESHVTALDMNCRAGGDGRARLRIEANFDGGAFEEAGEAAFLSAQQQDRLRRERFNANRGAEYYGEDFTRIGRATFGPRLEREVEYSAFPGRISELRLRARGSSIRCVSVVATFANGNSREVFQGIIAEGSSRRISFRNDRRVNRLVFVCQAERRDQGAIIISGRYDRSDRDRAGRGARVDWVRFGTTRFGRRTEVEQIFNRFSGPVSRIGIRPLDDDARCTRIIATFANGRTRDLPFGRGLLEEDRLYTVDLPGNQRNVRRLALVCRAVGARDVTLAIYGIRIEDRNNRGRGGRDFDGQDGGFRDPGFEDDRRRADPRIDRIRVDRGIREFGPGWTRVGRVTFGERLEREVQYTDFPAAVSGIRLQARGSNIRCRRVSARFRNGDRRDVFSGIIPVGTSKILSFRRDRFVTSMSFVCQAERRDRGQLLISGKYDGGRKTARPGRGRGVDADWVRIGRATFPQRVEVTRSFSTFPGAFRRLALRPLGDVRCRRILLVFQNGNKRDLPFSRSILEQDEVYSVSLPGNQRFIKSIGLACRAVRGRDASIAILGIR